MLRAFLLVALGGGVGAAARFGVSLWLADAAQRFPVHTLAVNLAGSFAIGVLGPALARQPAGRLMLVTGLLGGFTTFSAFSLEAVALVQAHRAGAAFAYVAVSVGGGLALAALGFALGRMLAPGYS